MVTDVLPPGVGFVSATSTAGTGCTQSSGTVTCALGGLGSGASATVIIKVTAPNASTTLTNTATVSADQPDPNPADNTATAVAYVGSADVSITKTASPSPALAKNNLTYTVVVTNNGPSPATGVKVSDPLPAGLEVHSVSTTVGSCVRPGNNVTCNLGGLGSGAKATITIGAKAPNSATTLANTATVMADQVDPDTANNTASVATPVLVRNCGRVLTHSTTLASDVGPCPGAGLVIGADNVTIDLGGHKVFASGPGDGTHPGIDIHAHTGVTVKNGEVSGFDAGVFINLRGANTVTGLNVHDNGGAGFDARLGDGIVVVHSSNNQILNNTVTHNGPHAGIGVFGLDSELNVIQGNTVTATVASEDGRGGEGIIVSAVLEPDDPRRGQSIGGNDVIDNTVSDNAGSGIVSVSNTQGHIRHNDVERNGVGSATSPRDGIDVTFDMDGGATGQTRDIINANTVRANGDNGIVVMSGFNTIASNRTDADNANADGSFDLVDTHPGCDANTWNRNTWGSGGFNQPCVTTGGTGPPAPMSASPASTAVASATPPPDLSKLAHLRWR